LSVDGWKFKDRKSAVVSISLVIVLLVAFTLAEYEMKRDHLDRVTQDANTALEEVSTLMDQRFSYAELLVGVVDRPAITQDVTASIALYHSSAKNPLLMSQAYNQLDAALGVLQKTLFDEPVYLSCQPYYEKLVSLEDKLHDPVALFDAKASLFNSLIEGKGFTARLVAKRSLVPLPLFDVASALENRP